MHVCLLMKCIFSSPQIIRKKMWRRLLTISVEDIGMGDPMAAVLVNNLYQNV